MSDPGPMPTLKQVNCTHCAAKFEVPTVIVGEPPNNEYVKLMAKLADHLTRKHKELAQQIIQSQVAISFDFSTVLMSAHFQSLDDGFAQYREAARHRIHTFTQKVRISDVTIEEKVALMGLSEEDATQIRTVLRWLRDLYEEKAEPLESSSRLVLVS